MPMVPVALSERIDRIFDEEFARAKTIEDPGIRSIVHANLRVLQSRIIRAENDVILDRIRADGVESAGDREATHGRHRGREGLQGLPRDQVACRIVLLVRRGHPPRQHAVHTQMGRQGGRSDPHRLRQGSEDHPLGGCGAMRVYLCDACDHRACESYTEDGSIPTLCPHGEQNPAWSVYGITEADRDAPPEEMPRLRLPGCQGRLRRARLRLHRVSDLREAHRGASRGCLQG